MEDLDNKGIQEVPFNDRQFVSQFYSDIIETAIKGF
jgi:hypothetical protein